MKFLYPTPLHTTHSPSKNSSVISRLCVETRRPAAPGAPCSMVPAAPSRCPLTLWVLHGAGGDAVPVRTTPRCLPRAVLSLRGRSCVLRRWRSARHRVGVRVHTTAAGSYPTQPLACHPRYASGLGGHGWSLGGSLTGGHGV